MDYFNNDLTNRTLAVTRGFLLNRKFKFLNSTSVWDGVFPLISSNMAATGTMKMAKSLGRHGALTALHKYYTVEELVECINELLEG